MIDLRPSRRTLLVVGAASLVGGGGAYLVEGTGPDKPDCQTTPPVDLDSPTIGRGSAAVPIEMYSDFSCPHCRDHALDVFPKIRKRYLRSGKATYTHHDFPIPVDDWSRPAASAAREVQRRADATTYFEYSSKLYQNQDSLSYKLFGNLAQSIGIDAGAVRKAARENRYCSLLNNSIERGVDREVKGTPTVFVGSKKLSAPSISDVDDAMQEASSNESSSSTPS